MVNQQATPTTQPEARRPKELPDGQRSYPQQSMRILVHQVGALPILDRYLERMRLHHFLKTHLPPDDKRTKVDTARVVLLLLKNLLVSREPVYGVAEWACNHAPELFQLWPAQLQYLNDDRIGRCLERVALALDTNLVIETVSHVVREFNVRLDELHNDSTTITFFGDYAAADEERSSAGLATPAITWGHNKDHRPDLKQLLYILTVSDDGGIPVFFQTASGNVTDDQTHQATWKLMAELVQRPDFLYVADCKLATTENMNAIHRQDGRFITVLPATRKEDTEFRRTLRDRPESVTWREAYRLTHDDGSVRDLFRVCTDEQVSKEGFRVLWFHSQGKAESDAAARARRLQRAIRELTDLRERLRGPRTRLRERGKVQAAVDAILDAQGVAEWLLVELREQEEATYRQAGRGRPTAATKYRREVKMRFEIVWQRQEEALRLAESGDGVFPLITNVTDWPAADVLRAYKRQPVIEKRFSQLKSQFGVAPVYLKNVRRIMGLLAVYFFALMLASLLERELRLSMGRSGLASIPLYPEGRRCVRPTLRQVLDVFEPITRQTLWETGRDALTIFRTELAPIHCTVLRLLGVPTSVYRA